MSDTCAYCGGPKIRERDHAKSDRSGTRIDRAVWLVAIARDDFCSRVCCERANGLQAVQESTCPQCGEKFALNVQGAPKRFCSRACREKATRRRQYAFREPGKCRGCGGDLDGRTLGCNQCVERHRNRRRRLDPEYLAASRERDRARHQKARRRRKKSGSGEGPSVSPMRGRRRGKDGLVPSPTAAPSSVEDSAARSSACLPPLGVEANVASARSQRRPSTTSDQIAA